MTADVIYDRSLPTDTISQKNTHYHRRFIIITRNYMLIFKEKNENLRRCKMVGSCQLYQPNSNCQLELELKLRCENAEKSVLSNLCLLLDLSGIGLQVNLNNVDAFRPEWRHKDQQVTRGIFMHIRFSSFYDATYLEAQICDKSAAIKYPKNSLSLDQQINSLFDKKGERKENEITKFEFYVQRGMDSEEENLALHSRRRRRDGQSLEHMHLLLFYKYESKQERLHVPQEQLMLLSFKENVLLQEEIHPITEETPKQNKTTKTAGKTNKNATAEKQSSKTI